MNYGKEHGLKVARRTFRVSWYHGFFLPKFMTLKITHTKDGYLVEFQTDKGKTYDKVIATTIQFENFCWYKGQFGGNLKLNTWDISPNNSRLNDDLSKER